jgi:hypothetical protein
MPRGATIYIHLDIIELCGPCASLDALVNVATALGCRVCFDLEAA